MAAAGYDRAAARLGARTALLARVGDQLGTIAKLIIWLVGIMAALQFLGIGQILQPINTLTLQIFEFLPRLIGAGLIFFVGLIVARIVRQGVLPRAVIAEALGDLLAGG